MKLPYILTTDSIQVHFPGEPLTLTEDHDNFSEVWDLLAQLRGQPISDQKLADKVRKLMSIKAAIESWSGGGFEVTRTSVLFRGEKLPDRLTKKIIRMFSDGDKGWVAFANFWARLQRNPSRRAVSELPGFVAQKSIAICPDGYIYCYKGLRNDYTDTHSGTFSSKPGEHNWMKRNEVSDNSSNACDHGFHVGTFSFAANYGKRVIVRLDPADVVRVPGGSEKMGVCQYWSIGDTTGIPLPGGVWTPGNDRFCKNYAPATKVYLHYDLELVAVGKKLNQPGDLREENRRVANVLHTVLKFPLAAAEIMCGATPAIVATEIDAARAKQLVDAITGRETHQRANQRSHMSNKVTGTEVRLVGFASEAIDPMADKLEKIGEKPKHVRKHPGAVVFPTDQQPPPSLSTRVKTLHGVKTVPAGSTPVSPLESVAEANKAINKRREEELAQEVEKAAQSARPDLDKMNRKALRQHVRDYFPTTGYGKWGSGQLREYIRGKWAETDAGSSDAGVIIKKDPAPKPSPVEDKKAEDRWDRMSRKDLRAAIRPYEISGASKLSAVDLRRVLKAIHLHGHSPDVFRFEDVTVPDKVERIREKVTDLGL